MKLREELKKMREVRKILLELQNGTRGETKEQTYFTMERIVGNLINSLENEKFELDRLNQLEEEEYKNYIKGV